MSEIIQKESKCNECVNYAQCKEIEVKFRGRVLEDRGNWREIYDSGKRVGTPIRRCTGAIVKTHTDKFVNKKVLEIGCGSSSEINKAFCKKNNVDYYGIDSRHLPFVFVDINVALLRKLQQNFFSQVFKTLSIKDYRLNKHQCYILDTFPSKKLKEEEFDSIYGNSTIEHWHEKEEDVPTSFGLYKKDIEVCYRLLKKGGVLLMNCPIYVHGNLLFMKGKVGLVEDICASCNWRRIVFEYWRRDYSDLMPYCPERRKKVFKEKFNIDLENIWLLNVVAEK